MEGANDQVHAHDCYANPAIAGIAKVDRLLAELEKNLDDAKLSLKGKLHNSRLHCFNRLTMPQSRESF